MKASEARPMNQQAKQTEDTGHSAVGEKKSTGETVPTNTTTLPLKEEKRTSSESQQDAPDRKVPFRDDMLVLSDEKSVGIFLHPLRQRMMERMMILAEPVTSKKLADELGIAPSSARHHMQKLESIGVVEKDHQQLIHGILATYYRLTDKCISLDVCNTGLWDPTRRLLEENARQVREGALKMMKDWQQSPSQNWDDAWGLIETNGVIHLTREETLALRDLIGDYLQQHSQPRPGTAPIRFDLISYRAGEVKDDGG